MTDKVTIAVQVDEDSELLRQFEEYQQDGNFKSRSEALRHMMRKEFANAAWSAGGPFFQLATSTASVLSGVAIVFALMVAIGFLPFNEGMLLAVSTLVTAAVLAFALYAGVIGRIDQAVGQRRRERRQPGTNEVEQ